MDLDHNFPMKPTAKSVLFASKSRPNKFALSGSMSFRVGTLLALVASLAYAVAPPANTSIGNQATATYTDASNTQRTVTSNTVVTIVQQVASFTLTTDGQSKPAAPGGQVVFPHTLTNTGNGSDNFNLTATNNGGGNFNLTNLTLYADSNGDGVPDNSTAITSTGALAAGATFKFVAVGIVPAVVVKLCWYLPPLENVSVVADPVIVFALTTVPVTEVVGVVPVVTFQVTPAFTLSVPAMFPVVLVPA